MSFVIEKVFDLGRGGKISEMLHFDIWRERVCVCVRIAVLCVYVYACACVTKLTAK